jgi:hypothetical protein
VLNAEDIRRMMLDVMEKHLSLKTEGDRSATNETFNLLLKAVAQGSSLETVCADSDGARASNTLREQLNVALDECALRHQEAEMNAALATAIPIRMPWGGVEVGIDTHDELFCDKIPELRTYTWWGAMHFFCIASAYDIWYCLLRQVEVLTSSRNPALRFFFLGLGLLMWNVWMLAR